ncbi:MAG: hypothetical protein LBG21_01485 [Campylobacteraceae bacterium]|jgi:disulfide bond formation protein DsbB|nr:hypothetical protein [Campylobacteraceae bacterium]
MEYSISFQNTLLKSIAIAQQSKIFWIFAACSLLIVTFAGYFIFDNYIGILSSADFVYIRIAFLFILLSVVICAINPKKFSNVGYYIGFIAAAFGIKNSLTLWVLYKFSWTQEFFMQENSFSNIVSCFFNISQIDNKCAFKTNMFTENILPSYANMVSINDFINISIMNIYVFISASTLFCILYFSKKIKA